MSHADCYVLLCSAARSSTVLQGISTPLEWQGVHIVPDSTSASSGLLLREGSPYKYSRLHPHKRSSGRVQLTDLHQTTSFYCIAKRIATHWSAYRLLVIITVCSLAAATPVLRSSISSANSFVLHRILSHYAFLGRNGAVPVADPPLGCSPASLTSLIPPVSTERC